MGHVIKIEKIILDIRQNIGYSDFTLTAKLNKENNMFMNPFFEVARAPLFTYHNGEKIESSNDALINTETKQIIGEVSKNYKVVTNQEVATIFDEAFDGIEKHNVIDHIDASGGRWKREIILEGDEYTWLVGGEDTCKMKVSIFNGYTGNRAVGYNISGWRQVCSNGMFGWSKVLSSSLSHMREGITEFIRNDFNNKVALFSEKAQIFEVWNELEFTQLDYEDFINSRKYLSDKMKDKYRSYYTPVMNRYGGNRETKWEAYNVLTAVAQHYTQAQKGSNVFSASYKRTEKLALELADWTPKHTLALR